MTGRECRLIRRWARGNKRWLRAFWAERYRRIAAERHIEQLLKLTGRSVESSGHNRALTQARQ